MGLQEINKKHEFPEIPVPGVQISITCHIFMDHPHLNGKTFSSVGFTDSTSTFLHLFLTGEIHLLESSSGPPS